MLEKIKEKLDKEIEKILKKENLTSEDFKILFDYKTSLELSEEKIKLEEERKVNQEKNRETLASLMKSALD